MIGEFLSRAASNDATTVEEEVTFWLASEIVTKDRVGTYDSRHGEVLLLTVLEERYPNVNDLQGHGLLGGLPSTSSPTMTPSLRDKTSLTPMFAVFDA